MRPRGLPRRLPRPGPRRLLSLSRIRRPHRPARSRARLFRKPGLRPPSSPLRMCRRLLPAAHRWVRWSQRLPRRARVPRWRLCPRQWPWWSSRPQRIRYAKFSRILPSRQLPRASRIVRPRQPRKSWPVPRSRPPLLPLRSLRLRRWWNSPHSWRPPLMLWKRRPQLRRHQRHRLQKRYPPQHRRTGRRTTRPSMLPRWLHRSLYAAW